MFADVGHKTDMQIEFWFEGRTKFQNFDFDKSIPNSSHTHSHTRTTRKTLKISRDLFYVRADRRKMRIILIGESERRRNRNNQKLLLIFRTHER